MKTEPPAASGGTETLPATKPPPHDDDLYRRIAVEELATHLLQAGSLLTRCEDLSIASYADQIGAIRAAGLLINANAQLAKSLAQMARVERCTRTIVETIQRPDPKIAELNAALSVLLKNQEFCAILERSLRQLVEIPAPKPPAIEYDI